MSTLIVQVPILSACKHTKPANVIWMSVFGLIVPSGSGLVNTLFVGAHDEICGSALHGFVIGVVPSDFVLQKLTGLLQSAPYKPYKQSHLNTTRPFLTLRAHVPPFKQAGLHPALPARKPNWLKTVL